MKITVSRLREMLDYDPMTGVFTWRVRRNQNVPAGCVAGSYQTSGYLQIRIDRVKQEAHCLAWLYMTGEWPQHELDHINRIKDDNRWGNLRASTRSLNLLNQTAAMSNNSVGFLGVSRRGKRYIARLKVRGRSTFLGLFDQPETAHAAYVEAKRQALEGMA